MLSEKEIRELVETRRFFHRMPELGFREQKTASVVFQPAEELLSRAQKMVDDGVMEHSRADAAFGVHAWNNLVFRHLITKHNGVSF